MNDLTFFYNLTQIYPIFDEVKVGYKNVGGYNIRKYANGELVFTGDDYDFFYNLILINNTFGFTINVKKAGNPWIDFDVNIDQQSFDVLTKNLRIPVQILDWWDTFEQVKNDNYTAQNNYFSYKAKIELFTYLDEKIYLSDSQDEITARTEYETITGIQWYVQSDGVESNKFRYIMSRIIYPKYYYNLMDYTPTGFTLYELENQIPGFSKPIIGYESGNITFPVRLATEVLVGLSAFSGGNFFPVSADSVSNNTKIRNILATQKTNAKRGTEATRGQITTSFNDFLERLNVIFEIDYIIQSDGTLALFLDFDNYSGLDSTLNAIDLRSYNGVDWVSDIYGIRVSDFIKKYVKKLELSRETFDTLTRDTAGTSRGDIKESSLSDVCNDFFYLAHFPDKIGDSGIFFGYADLDNSTTTADGNGQIVELVTIEDQNAALTLSELTTRFYSETDWPKRKLSFANEIKIPVSDVFQIPKYTKFQTNNTDYWYIDELLQPLNGDFATLKLLKYA